jgi:hypothetical protein
MMLEVNGSGRVGHWLEMTMFTMTKARDVGEVDGLTPNLPPSIFVSGTHT